jgi:tRNA A-37 threonylcarbamoyl transferase component Bud32/capsular polysaccharide biosynthesis protein
MNALFAPCLALIGFWEMVIIFAVLLVMLAVAGVVIFLLVKFASRKSEASQAAPVTSPAPGSHCPRCGAALTANAPQGLCPRCVFEVGMGTQVADEPLGEKTKAPTPEALAAQFPQFEILELLGQGGMGAVYKARQKDLDRVVALKVLPAEAGRDPAFAERFTREARALAKLSHPNIVGVHEFGQSGGFYFFAMEFVDGANLRQTLRAQKLSPREAMAIVPQICEALQYAHDQGIVHRDIKPENVLLDKQGRVKIADFGLARLLGKDPFGARLTRSAEVMGTPQYMAPEQLEKPLEVDHRADIYSLGVVFYEMLTGELPLGRFAPPSRKVQVDVRLDDVVLRALEKEPELRYQQASQFKTQVETISAGGTSQPVAAKTDPRAIGKNLTLAGAIALAVFVLTVIATCVIALGRTKTYVSTAKVMVHDQGAVKARGDLYFLQTQLEILQSEVILGQVASNLNLAQRWGTEAGQLETDQQRVLLMLRQRIKVRLPPGTTILSVECSSDSPREAEEIADQVVGVFYQWAGPTRAAILQRATPPLARPANVKSIFVMLLLVASILALVSGAVAFAIVTKRSLGERSLAAQQRSKNSGVVWVLSAVAVAVGIALVALATGAASLVFYLSAQARQRAEAVRDAEMQRQAAIVQQVQEAESMGTRESLQRQLRAALRNYAETHPVVVNLRAQLEALDAAATNASGSTTNLVPSPAR